MKKRPLLSLALLAAAGIALWWGGSFWSKPAPRQGQSVEAEVETSEAARLPEAVPRPSERSDFPSASAPSSGRESVTKAIREALEVMRAGDPVEIERVLAGLDEAFGRVRDPAGAIAAIMEFLNSGADASTGMGFVVGQEGRLAEATTLRVYLMDQLGRLCRESGSPEASEMGREILRDFGSSDEWAVSLRNVAWTDPDSGAFLEERVNAMIRHPQWQENPTAGLLEAFDVIVHTGSMNAVPELARMVALPDSPVGRASGVALDRLAGSSPLALTSLLNAEPELMSATPMARADLFAHADLAVPEQRAQMEDYLLRPDVELPEREKFLSSLIQTGRFVSHNLITPFVPPEEPAQAERRLEVL
ncbi:MAG: hypothetical protein EOP85_21300, partial [Verrucomicrobiaceae bacterium]